MRRSPFVRVCQVASLVAFGSSLAGSAAAHISLDQGGTHKSRYGDGPIKDGPCGMAGGTRGTNVYTYAPGETVSVAIVEFIPHPSYFRVAFDDDGDDDFAPPASIQPIDPMRPCPLNAADKCGASDYYNNATVLPDMDDLNPHLTAMAGQKYTFDVKMPDVECDNCTLQIIQVMEDTIHGAYNPVPGNPADTPYVADIYHQCIDLVLTREGGTGPTGPASGDGGVGSGKAPASSGSSGGCAVARGGGRVPSGAAVFFGLVVGAAWSRRSRRRTTS